MLREDQQQQQQTSDISDTFISCHILPFVLIVVYKSGDACYRAIIYLV